MKQTTYRVVILTIPILVMLGMLMGGEAGTVQQPFSMTVVPSKPGGQCSYGNHGPTRGRPVFNGPTLVADDGCPLVGASMYDFSEVRSEVRSIAAQPT